MFLLRITNKYGRCLETASFVQLKETALHWLSMKYPNLGKEDLTMAFYRLVAGDKVFYQFEKRECRLAWRSLERYDKYPAVGSCRPSI